MLSDNAEKSRNPLKKAMKRRNAKTVQFAAPTYVEASDNDYSSDEDEENEVAEPYAGIVEAEKAQQEAQDAEGEARASSEARTSHEDHRLSTSSRDSFDREQAATLAQAADEPQLSPKLVDKTEAAPLKSRKGTPRNTDSFLKDDSIETRKITLTPGLLREDGTSIKSASSESARNTSMESLTKTVSPPEQTVKKEAKKEKEKKEKKQGMLSGLFKSKKKDKKSKDELGAEVDAEKQSNEFSRDSPRASPAPSGRSSPSQQSASITQVSPGLTVDSRKLEVQPRQPTKERSKLTKTPPAASSPSRSPAREESPAQRQQPAPEAAKPTATQAQAQADGQSAEYLAELQGSEAAHEMAAAEDVVPQTAQQTAPAPQKEGPLSPLTNML